MDFRVYRVADGYRTLPVRCWSHDFSQRRANRDGLCLPFPGLGRAISFSPNRAKIRDTELFDRRFARQQGAERRERAASERPVVAEKSAHDHRKATRPIWRSEPVGCSDPVQTDQSPNGVARDQRERSALQQRRVGNKRRVDSIQSTQTGSMTNFGVSDAGDDPHQRDRRDAAVRLAALS